MEVNSTYNFIPAPSESEVFKPDWADQVSHDIPFSDGESGEIELTITARTPVFVRNGHSKKDAEEQNDKFLSFSHIKKNGRKEFFIPATSLKGMFRNVFEIITKSRMTQVQDHRHSVRQIMKTKDTVVDEGYDLAKEKRKIRAGWLKYENGEYFIYDAGSPMKIRYTDLDVNLGANFEAHFAKNGRANLKENFSNRTARYKYEELKIDFDTTHQFEKHPLEEEKQGSWVSEFQPLQYARFRETDNQIFEGHIVCSGQATDYSVKTSRKGEYVFRGRKSDILSDSSKKFKVSNGIFEAFLLVNRDNKSDELEDWKYLKNMDSQGIPVFFRFNENNKSEIKDFGLTFMYKEPAKYSVKEQFPLKEYDYSILDLSEVVFGSSASGKKLKGRVFFSHAFCNTHFEEGQLKTERIVMGSPKSSYFPFYLQQSGKQGKVKSYNNYNVNSKLSGFKKHYIHKNVKFIGKNIENENMVSKFKPLPEGTSFKAKVRFHNLRKMEIGALISAITLHNHNQEAFHSIGYAKPIGFGKIKVDIKFENYIDYLLEFEKEIRKSQKNWSISQLLQLAKETDSNRSYMELEEFQLVKNEGGYLEKVKPISAHGNLMSDRDLAEEIEKSEKEKAIQEEKRKLIEKEKKQLRLKPFLDAKKIGDDLFLTKNYEAALEQYDVVLELMERIGVNDNSIRQNRNICIKKIRAKGLVDDGLVIPIESKVFNGEKQNIEKIFKANGVISDDKNLQTLKMFVERCISTSNKRWKKPGKQDWSLVSKWVGKETALQWYNELFTKQQ